MGSLSWKTFYTALKQSFLRDFITGRGSCYTCYVPWSRTGRKRTPPEEPPPKLINFWSILKIWIYPRTDVATYRNSPSHAHMHTGMHDTNTKKRKKTQANWNGNFSKPVQSENSPSENNCQDAQNQNSHRVLPWNLIQTIKRHVSLFGQIHQMALMVRRLIVAPRIACRVFGWPTTSLLLGGSRGR